MCTEELTAEELGGDNIEFVEAVKEIEKKYIFSEEQVIK